MPKRRKACRTVTHSAYARKAGMSRPYVSKLVKLGIVPIEPDGRIDPRKADVAIRSNHDPTRNSDSSFAEARRRKEVALATLRELEVQKRAGEVVEVTLIRRELEGVILHQRTILLSLPAQIGRDIDEPALRVRVVAAVDRHVREALEALANYDPVGAGGADGDAEVDEFLADSVPAVAGLRHGVS